jgi:hypothetical protein|tara:strand:+ start:1270 stop:1482 length:213 start_codon:yes stop_codon:yes gene_type:complete
MIEDELYKVECEDINNIISKIKNKSLSSEEVSSSNDKKYRDLRKKIMVQNKEIESLKKQVKILEGLVKNN